MKKTNAERDRIEHLMKQVQLIGPAQPLKNRVTSAAAKAWNQAPPEIPWQIPSRRLAASAAAAVLFVSLADVFSHRAAAQWHHEAPVITGSESLDLNDLSVTDHGAVGRQLAASSCRPPGAGSLTLHSYIEQVREMLEESQPSQDVGPPASTPGRSRLVPTSSPTKSWS
jgi:hypothetical protein